MIGVGVLVLALSVLAPVGAGVFVLARASAADRSVVRRRVLRSTTIAGALGITPLALLMALGAYAGLSFFFVAWTVGALYGVLVGIVAIRVRQARFRQRDRSG